MQKFFFIIKRSLAISLFVCIAASMQSCYHYRVLTTKSDPSTEYKKEVLWSYAWGLYNNPKDFTVENCGDSNGVDEVRFTRSFGGELLTILTLGIVSPVTVQWKCHKPCQRSGNL